MINKLENIKQLFNTNIDISFFKSQVEERLKNYLNNYAFLIEKFGKNLPNNLKLEDFSIEYRYFKIFINMNPLFFSVRYDVHILGRKSSPIFIYIMEFNADGHIQADSLELFLS